MHNPGQGWKVAYLIDPTIPSFRGLFHGTYSLESSFSCYKGHTTPSIDCTCGFHTYHDYQDAYLEHLSHPGSIILSCEIFGTIVMHSFGSRGESQVILNIQYDKYCSRMYCQRKAVGFAPKYKKPKKNRANYFDTYCSKHMKRLEKRQIPTSYFVDFNSIIPATHLKDDFLLSK